MFQIGNMVIKHLMGNTREEKLMENAIKAEKIQEISKEEVLDILMNIMPGEETAVMLNTVTLPDIQRIFNETETREYLIQQISNDIMKSETFLLALKRIPALIKNKNKLLQKHEVDYYDSLSREDKKAFCIEMINQRDFQRDMCETIFDELERQVSSAKPLLDALDIKKNFLELYDNSGYHKYNSI